MQVAVAHPAHKQRGGDAGDAIARALAEAVSAKAQAESALGDVLQAAAIGDLLAAQDAADRAEQAGQAALKQAELVKTIAVEAAGKWKMLVQSLVSILPCSLQFVGCQIEASSEELEINNQYFFLGLQNI